MQSPRQIGGTSQNVKGDGTTPLSMKLSNAETSSSMTHSNGQIKFPMTSQEALKHFSNYLTDFEKKEILEF